MLTLPLLFEFKTWKLFLSLTAIVLVLSSIMQYRMMDFDVFANLAGNQLSIDQINEALDSQSNYQWLGYLIAPLILCFKTMFAAFFIHMFLVFAEYDVAFKDLFKLNLIAGSVYLLFTCVQITLLYTVDVETLSPTLIEKSSLSLALFVDKENTIIPLYAFLNTLSLYEVLYLLVTIFGIKHLIQETLKTSAYISLFIWGVFTLFSVTVQSFIQLNMQ